ncbi:MAG: NAD(P)/FAD-dependent oxidoreductase, partial [Halobacteriales archaeon]|nr:NAD(P)/FAD-dependent oxidoreductase [Halobacteriales archaeon]
MESADVVVVGGGPAGTAAAHAAARGGADVILTEKGVPRADRDGPGPDSTDAAGILDYWVDIWGINPADFPDGVLLRELDRAEFIGPSASVTIRETGIESSYSQFGFTYDRAKFDDWMIDRARQAGADCRIGVGVRDVETSLEEGPRHTVVCRNGETIETDALILADGPQRTVTMGVLNDFLPAGRAESALSATHANHIAYQEYREFPEAAFEPTALKFWWGHMPGETAYPWVFPNDGNVARVGLTMPIGLDLATVRDRDTYKLLRPDDERIPSGRTYIERLLDLAYPSYDVSDFPLVEDRGKRDGTETYPISSTRPIDSPVGANVAVTGGAMGATSAFHEGGAHVAVATGRIAGDLAARGQLDRYNNAWKRTIGEEVNRNVAMADLVHDYGPRDWDRAFRVA